MLSQRKHISNFVIDIPHQQQHILGTIGDKMCTSANTENIVNF